MCAERSTEGSNTVSNATRKNSRQIQARIFLLDDSVHTFSINSCAIGHELFVAIIEKQNILEADYFDLEYVNNEGVRCWINHNKCIVKQVGAGKDMVFIFAVKFYTSHPNLLEEEYTRYLFALQIKRDIVSGQLICSTNTAALLASYIVQAEIGDFLDDEYIDNTYLRHLKLANQSNDEILNKIMEFHKTHIGMSSTEADFHLLDTARKIEYYGVKMHLAKDHENLPLNLSVTHMGVVVFQNLTKINTFSWAKIRKLSFKRKKFLIKLHPEGYGYYKGMVEFYFESRDDCKRFWKKCIEHHAFFRCPASEKSLKKTPKVVTKGSSFRYCGRTQKELIEHVRESYSSKRDSFVRPSKARVSKSPHTNKHARHGKSYHPFAIKSSYSAPSRAVSAGSDLDRADSTPAAPHTPCRQKSASALTGNHSTGTKTRWSQSARQSPRDEHSSRKPPADRDHARTSTTLSGGGPGAREHPSSTRSGSGSQKRARKGRKFIQVSRTGSSDDDDDDDKRVTASEMSLSSSGHWADSGLHNGIASGSGGGSRTDHPNEEPLPAREAFRGAGAGGERLCRQRASIGGFGDVSDSDQPSAAAAGTVASGTFDQQTRSKTRVPTRQGSEPLTRKSSSPPNPSSIALVANNNNINTTSTGNVVAMSSAAIAGPGNGFEGSSSQRVVCIDQYCSGTVGGIRRQRHGPDPVSCRNTLRQQNQQPAPLLSAKRYKSTPNDVAGHPKLQIVDQLDSSELLSDIPYVLLRRHKSNEPSAGPASVKSASQSQRSLASKSLKSVKDVDVGGPGPERNSKEASHFGAPRIRHSKSLDRRLAAMDTTSRLQTMAPKSPKLLREEYMQSQRRHVSDRDTIEALKNQLRTATSVRSVSRLSNGDVSFRGPATGPMFVSAYRLPPVNNFSAKDDTMSPPTLDLDRLYGNRAGGTAASGARNRTRHQQQQQQAGGPHGHEHKDSGGEQGEDDGDDGDDEVDNDDLTGGAHKRKPSKLLQAGQKALSASAMNNCKQTLVFSDSDDSQLHETADLECLLADLLPGNPVYLDSSCSSDDGEFDLSPDRCGRPRSVSESEFKLRTPRSSRRSSLCRGHNSSLSLTDSSFNSGTSFQSEEPDDIDDPEDGAEIDEVEKDELSGSPYSFLAECAQHQPQQDYRESKNVQGSSGDSPQLPDDDVPKFQKSHDSVDLQVLEAPQLLDDSPEESEVATEPESHTPVPISMSVDHDDSESSSSNEDSNLQCASSSASASSDRVVIVSHNTETDATFTEQDDVCVQPTVVVTTAVVVAPEPVPSVSQVLESMLQKRLTGCPFVRTSTPTQEYVQTALSGSPDRGPVQPPPQTDRPLLQSVTGVIPGRVSPYSPLPSYLRRPYASSSSSSSTSDSRGSPGSHPSTGAVVTVTDIACRKNTNPFIDAVLSTNPHNPFVAGQSHLGSGSDVPDPVPDECPPDSCPTVNAAGNSNNYELLFDQTMVSGQKEATRKSVDNDFPALAGSASYKIDLKEDLGRALVFLNDDAITGMAVSAGIPSNQVLADTFPDTVESNLICYESSDYNSRPQSIPDEEEPDEYVLPNDHQSFSEDTSSSSSSSRESSESGHYQAATISDLNLKESIQEHSETSTSASEGSEDIEPFPPPPPPSDLLIFDEREEDIFQQLEERIYGGHDNIDRESNMLPLLDSANSPTDFPQPPPLLPTAAVYPKDDFSSSEVPSLFADNSAATSVGQNEDCQFAANSPPTHMGNSIEEFIVPQHTSPLLDFQEEQPGFSSSRDCDYGRVSYEDAFPQLDHGLSSLDPRQLITCYQSSSQEIVEDGD